MSTATANGDSVESWAGEVRVNLVRLAALIAFYAYHLVNVVLARDDPALAGTYHVAATALVMVWATGAVVLYLVLSRRQMPPGLKYAVTAWDAVQITTLVALAGGPQSPLVILYFLLIAAAPLRLSLRLVYVATILAVGGYLFLLGHYVFYQVGSERYYATPELRIPRTQEAVLVLGLLTSGVLAGQVVRQAHRLAPGARATAGAPEAEARADGRLVAGGLLAVVALVALGLLFSATAGPPVVAGAPAWAVVAVILVLFVAAILAGLAEARRPGPRAAAGNAQSPAGGRGENP